jgi:hypothetical protein
MRKGLRMIRSPWLSRAQAIKTFLRAERLNGLNQAGAECETFQKRALALVTDASARVAMTVATAGHNRGTVLDDVLIKLLRLTRLRLSGPNGRQRQFHLWLCPAAHSWLATSVKKETRTPVP